MFVSKRDRQMSWGCQNETSTKIFKYLSIITDNGKCDMELRNYHMNTKGVSRN